MQAVGLRSIHTDFGVQPTRSPCLGMVDVCCPGFLPVVRASCLLPIAAAVAIATVLAAAALQSLSCRQRALPAVALGRTCRPVSVTCRPLEPACGPLLLLLWGRCYACNVSCCLAKAFFVTTHAPYHCRHCRHHPDLTVAFHHARGCTTP